jgi:hypothetical protein
MNNRGDKMNAVAIDVEMMVRNPQSINAMDDDTKAVHYRLEQWGKWSKDGEVRAWPSITPMGRMVEEGPHGAGQVGKPPISMPEPIAEVDAAVARLGQIDQRVIKQYYRYWEPTEVMARRLGMRKRQFENVLRRSRWRILGFLDALQK